MIIRANSAYSLVRIVCAIFVMIYHIEGAKHLLHMPSLFTNIPFRRLWPITFGPFLSLCIFIHTLDFLKKNDFNFNKFAFKRWKRVYPLYAIVSFLGIFIFPHFLSFPPFPFPENQTLEVALLSFFMLPHFISVFIGEVTFINIFWYLGVQEPFLLLVSLISKLFRKYLLHFLVCFWFLLLLLRLSKSSLFNYFFGLGIAEDTVVIIDLFFQILPLEFGVVSAILAYGSHHFEWEKKFPKNSVFCLLSVVFFSLLFAHEEKFFSHSYFAVLVSLIILNLKSFNFSNHIVDKLSKLSYGFYATHSIWLVFFLNLVMDNLYHFNFLLNITLYAVVLCGGAITSLGLTYGLNKPHKQTSLLG